MNIFVNRGQNDRREMEVFEFFSCCLPSYHRCASGCEYRDQGTEAELHGFIDSQVIGDERWE